MLPLTSTKVAGDLQTGLAADKQIYGLPGYLSVSCTVPIYCLLTLRACLGVYRDARNAMQSDMNVKSRTANIAKRLIKPTTGTGYLFR